jgi:hypothetical protein
MLSQWGVDWWFCRRCRLRYAFVDDKGTTGEEKPPET